MPIHEPHLVALPTAHVLANLKAYVALVGLIATALLDKFTHSTVLEVIVIVCSTFGVWAAKNTDAPQLDAGE